LLRRQQVRPLPGGLDRLLLSRHNPELIVEPGILLSTPSMPAPAWLASRSPVPSAHLNTAD